MTLQTLIDRWATSFRAEGERASAAGFDVPVVLRKGRRISTIGTLHLYEFEAPEEVLLGDDLAVTLVPPEEEEATEGLVLSHRGRLLLIQTFDVIGQDVPQVTLVPDTLGFLERATQRLADLTRKADSYHLGPAERLVPWLGPEQAGNGTSPQTVASSFVLSTLWHDDLANRRLKLAGQAVELVRANKRVLLVSPDHHSADEALGTVARALKRAGLQFKSLLSRYELSLAGDVAGIPLQELGFEAQMHQFYAKSRAEKAALRKKYDRFRELSPLLAYKARKQGDLDEVKLLEWRLLTQLTDLQTKIKEIDATLSVYENLSLWKRLGMQAAGKNTESLAEYRTIYAEQVRGLMGELDVAKHRIEELAPEAAVPKDLRPEFAELKEDVKRLGGTKKIRELLAAEEGTNRQAFMQNRRVVVTTAARVIVDPLFLRVRFDVLLADEAPLIPAPFLIAAAGLVCERIVLSGDTGHITPAGPWSASGDLPSWLRQAQPSPVIDDHTLGLDPTRVSQA